MPFKHMVHAAHPQKKFVHSAAAQATLALLCALAAANAAAQATPAAPAAAASAPSPVFAIKGFKITGDNPLGEGETS